MRNMSLTYYMPRWRPVVTDSKTVVEDLAAWLTQIWDEEERLAKAALGYETSDHDGPFLRHTVDYLGPELADHIAAHDPASVLARIAADRKILALHSGEQDWPCQVGNYVEEPCETRLLLASRYQDRPGFRPEWSVERQGVEW